MTITHDIIAAIQGPGWKYGLSRILVDEDDNGVVFIAGSQEPFAEFTVNTVSTSRGTGTSDEGDISWRRRGSSCQYKLAKCKLSTETMASWWGASKEAPEPEPEVDLMSYAGITSEEEKSEEKPKPAPKKKAPAKETTTKKTTEKKAEPTEPDSLDDLL